MVKINRQALRKAKKAKKAGAPKSKKSNRFVSAEDKFQIVPWSSSEEWNNVCRSFHDKNYKYVISEILIWQKRVPSLPVGVEATLFILEAVCYDDLRFEPNSNHSDDQARALYSLALVRYLNHVGLYAAHAMGEKSTAPTRDLALSVGTPDWLVELRNQVSHGTTTPSTESLRVAGDFIVEWLKEKYWKHPESLEPDTDDLLQTSNGSDETEALLMSQILSAFIAARIYKFREVHIIHDPEITKYLRDKPQKPKTKTVIVGLKPKLAEFLQNKSTIMCSVIAQEMIPSADFYADFKGLFDGTKFDPFDQLFLIWVPIIKLLERKGKILSVCMQLGELHVSPENESNRDLSALWIDKLLQMLEESGKSYSHKLQNLLRIVMMHPNSHSKTFLPRLMRLIEKKLGEDKIRKLETLASIWIDDSCTETSKTSRKSIALQEEKFFSVHQIIPSASRETNNPTETSASSEKWVVDCRDGETFWNRNPLGTVFLHSS